MSWDQVDSPGAILKAGQDVKVYVVKVDLETKITKVVFDKEKIDLSKIEKAISGLGYQANETLADPIAYEGLPGCCKIGGMH